MHPLIYLALGASTADALPSLNTRAILAYRSVCAPHLPLRYPKLTIYEKVGPPPLQRSDPNLQCERLQH